MNTFRPDETLYDIFKRVRKDFSIELNLQYGKTELFAMGETCEIITRSSAIDSRIAYDIISQLNHKYHDFKITHISMKKWNMIQTAFPNCIFHTMFHLSQFNKYLEELEATLGIMKRNILILHGLYPILASQMDLNRKSLENSLAMEVLQRLRRLSRSKYIIIVWISKVFTSKGKGISLREGNSPVNIAWKEYFKKIIFID